jgi:hypothetical protein
VTIACTPSIVVGTKSDAILPPPPPPPIVDELPSATKQVTTTITSHVRAGESIIISDEDEDLNGKCGKGVVNDDEVEVKKTLVVEKSQYEVIIQSTILDVSLTSQQQQQQIAAITV